MGDRFKFEQVGFYRLKMYLQNYDKTLFGRKQSSFRSRNTTWLSAVNVKLSIPKDGPYEKDKNNSDPMYWKVNTDEVIQSKIPYETNNSSGLQNSVQLKFTVHGKPQPLRRHRSSKGFMYNPSAKAQNLFRGVVKSILFPGSLNIDDDDDDDNDNDNDEYFFHEDDFLVMNIIFKLRRPRKHFIGNKAGPGRLRETAPKQLFAGRVDVDNLAKFVLDSLNGLVYLDDRQVVSLHAIKVYDCEGDCEGSTEISIKSVNDEEMEKLLSNIK